MSVVYIFCFKPKKEALKKEEKNCEKNWYLDSEFRIDY